MIGHGFLLEALEMQPMNWETAVFVGIPAAGAVGYISVRLVAMFLRAQKEWSNQLENTVKTSNEVIDRNTQVFGNLQQTLGEFSGVIQKCKGPKG